ncbi:hypothetical protein [Oceanobacillus massiliensis]|uniref:hypothetical protein n=1 Tax=Oceanobacillus massiliensis TaxID=1465765 RepID=UPI0030177839
MESKENGTDVDSEESNSLDLHRYRPLPGIEKLYLQDEEYNIKYEIIASNDTNVQRIIEFGDIVQLQILEWTSDKISIVYTESSPSDTSDQLEKFEPYEAPELLVDIEEAGTEESELPHITDDNLSVEVPAGKFHDVIEVRKTTVSTGTGNKMIFTSYYAPEVGLIKETRETTGDNGYQTETVLNEITE